jgi:hypothetical protein
VHESEGVTWFNKERFEELILWLFITRLADLSAQRPSSPRSLSAWFGAAGREVRRLADLAASAGYRKSLFLNLVTTLPMSPPSSKRSTTGEKPKKSALNLKTAFGSTKDTKKHEK